MARMRPAVLIAGAALVGLPAAASAAITPPTITPVPAVINGATQGITWSASTFDPLAADTKYVLEVATNAGPFAPVATIPSANPLSATLAVANGTTYHVRVIASEIPCLSPAPDNLSCTDLTPAPPATTNSADIVFRVDSQGPAASLNINGGALWTNDPLVQTGLAATDAPAPGLPMRMLLGGSQAAVSCAQVLTCGTAFAANPPFTLTGGDGQKTVYARVLDALGNSSTVASDTIGLDTVAPDMWGSVDDGHLTVDAGTTVNFITKQAIDTGSGINEPTLRWTFCSGCAPGATGRSPSKRFDTPGNYLVTLWADDVAGNTGTDSFVLKVEAVAPPSNGGSSGGSAGGSSGGSAGGGSGGSSGGSTGGPSGGTTTTTTRLITGLSLQRAAKVGRKLRVRVTVSRATSVGISVLSAKGAVLRRFRAKSVPGDTTTVFVLPAPTATGTRIVRVAAENQVRSLRIRITR